MLSPDRTLEVVIQIAVLLFAVSFHESAHGWVAMKCGDNTARDLGRITMNPMKHLDPIGSLLFPIMLAISGLPIFGWAKPVPISLRGVRNPRRANLLVSAAGPLSNLLLAAAFAVPVLLLKAYERAGGRAAIARPLFYLAAASVLVNVVLAVFNLIPVPPLDGFGVVESLLPVRLIRVAMWLRRYGFIVLIVAMFTGILGLIMRPVQHVVVNWLTS